MPYNSTKRNEVLDEIQSEQFDILIIGGGITGAGIALDAVSRGFKVALIEKQDFAAGTSSRSTKLVHGGLRYLKNLEFKLVREVGLERAVAHKNAPHLVRPEKMLLPFVEGGSLGKFTTSMALWLYDVLAGVKGTDKRKMLSKSRTLRKEPLLREEGLLGSGYYAEYRTDDARLTIEVLKTAVSKGACIVNYIAAKGFTYQDSLVIGAECEDEVTKTQFQINARFVVNATGPWVDELREIDQSLNNKRLHLTKGVHLVVSHDDLPLKQSVYFDVGDGRMIFAIPRMNVAYIGTTDTSYTGDKKNPKVNREDVNYLLDAVNQMFPDVQLGFKNVISSWAGLRPLIDEEGKDQSELSRSDELFVSGSGLITMAGGKLTGYRLMAKKVMRLICDELHITRKCKTRRIKLCGGDFKRPRKELYPYIGKVCERLAQLNLNKDRAFYLVHLYGTQTELILNIFKKKSLESLVEAEAYWAIHYEGAITLEDFFSRRTGKLLFEPNEVIGEIEKVLLIFKNQLGWDESKEAMERNNMKNKVLSLTLFED